MSLTFATLLLAGIFAFTGLFAITAAIAGWEWFFTSANSRMLTGRLSRRWARVVYFLLGLAIVGMAVHLYVNIA